MLRTLQVLGMELPVLADLGQGYFLVAHPNGPGLATENMLAALPWCFDDDELRPFAVKAVRHYMEVTYPLVEQQDWFVFESTLQSACEPDSDDYSTSNHENKS